MCRTIFLLISTLCLLAQVQAQPGTLDLNFNSDGKVTHALSSSDDLGYAMAIQPDGKILIAGFYNNGNHNDFIIARLNPDGSLDNTFSGDGTAKTDFNSGGDDRAFAIALQPDGKILVAGYSEKNSTSQIIVARYTTSGSLDTGFDFDGFVSTSVNNKCEARGMVLSNGKIIVVGFTNNGSNDDFVVVRYNSNGTLDATFNSTGIVQTAIGPSDDVARAVAIQPDGKLVVVGRSGNGSNFDVSLVRYNSDGSLDTGFDFDGKVVTALGTTGTEEANAVGFTADGKILVAGFATPNGSNRDFALFRYNTNGALDNSFSSDGIVTTEIGSSNEEARSMLIQPDGKIVLGGYSYNGSNADFALVKYNSDGTPDTQFGNNSKVTTSIGSDADEVYALALQSDGKIVAGGAAKTGSDFDFALARYNNDVMVSTTYLANDYSVSISPNPSNGVFNIVCDRNISSIKVFDTFGRVVIWQDAQILKGNWATLRLDGLSTGLYRVQISGDGFTTTQSIMKQ